MINATPIGGEESRRQSFAEEWRKFLHVEPRPPMGVVREVVTVPPEIADPQSRVEVQKLVARESSRIMREQFEKLESAPKVARKAARLAKKMRKRMEKLQRHRATFIEYARQRIESEDWHALSDVANDLRELDVEIRMTEAAGK